MTDLCLVAGASVAAFGFAQAVRQQGYRGRVVIVGAEAVLPYERPPLSKQYILGKKSEEELLFRPASFYTEQEIELWLGDPISFIDLERREAELLSGRRVGFDQLVLATGAAPIQLPIPGSELTGVHYLRSLEDARALRTALEQAERVLVIGGGFIGCEMAASVRLLGKTVTLVEMQPVLLKQALGETVGRAITALHARWGVDLRLGTRVQALEGGERVERAVLADGTLVECDLVVVGIGVKPTLPAVEGQLEFADGVVVDATLAAKVPGVWAAGDVARWWHPELGRLIRLEHYENALAQGGVVAKGVAGHPEIYSAVPSFWSDQYDVTMQQYGYPIEWDELVVRGNLDELAFTAFYLQGGRVIGVVLVRRPRELRPARRLVETMAKVDRNLLADPAIDLRSLITG